MKSFIIVAMALAVTAIPQILPPQDGCPPVTEVNTTGGIQPRPENIPSGCSEFEVLVARGTGEPDFDKFGVIVGDPVVSNLSVQLPGARGYPVQYPANGSLASPRIGAADVIARLTAQSKACPDQRFALVGYSQGAFVMRAAARDLDVAIQEKILALVMFGDPAGRLGNPDDWPAALQPRHLQICAEEGGGDPVCNSTGTCIFYHLIYVRPNFINTAVDFIANAFNGGAAPV